MLRIINIFAKQDIDRLMKGENSFFNKTDLENASNIDIIYINTNDFNENDFLEKILLDDDIKNVIIFADERTNLNNILYRCFFIANIIITKSSDAFVTKQISQKRKQFNTVIQAFESADMIEPLRLPFRSFSSVHLKALEQLMLTFDINFKEIFERHLSGLKRHRYPMRRSNSKQKYYIDDKDLHFSLGKELHSRHGTKEPHNIFCDAAAKYRFGCRINESIHFNVCKENSAQNRLAINLTNCHDEQNQYKNKTHLNIFSNDYIT